MYKTRAKRLAPVVLLLSAMLLRAVIPAGYMPAAAGSGLLFGLCPEGLSDGMTQILPGDAAHAHHHMDHGDHGDHGDSDHQCPIGHMLLSADAGTLADVVSVAVMVATTSIISAIKSSFTSVSHNSYHSRGPPA